MKRSNQIIRKNLPLTLIFYDWLQLVLDFLFCSTQQFIILVYYALAARAISRVWVLEKQKLDMLSKCHWKFLQVKENSEQPVNSAKVKNLDRNDKYEIPNFKT